jgi:citrate synthase
MPKEQTTRIATSNAEDVFVRGQSLCEELIGHLSFTEMIYFQMLGKKPQPAQTAMVDACLVTLMEHGLTPSAITARLVYSSAPEAMQGAVAAGLMGVGSLFAGTMDGCGQLLQRIVAADDQVTEARTIAQEHRTSRTPLPGFGHPQHKPDDPRALRLFVLAREHGVFGQYCGALAALGAAVDAVYAKHITINATGAIAAVLADVEVPLEILRGFALIARCAGLVGHIHEEQSRPALGALWEGARTAVPYESG